MPQRDTNIIHINPSPSVCNNSSEIAARLRELADEIERDEFSNVRVACTVIDTDQGIFRRTLGPPGTCLIEVVGLLTWAINNVISGK